MVVEVASTSQITLPSGRGSPGSGQTAGTGSLGSEFGQTPGTDPVVASGFGQAAGIGSVWSGFGQDAGVAPGSFDGGGGAGLPAAQLHDWPLLHTPWKFDGHPTLQLLPQAPQL
jgi:hypothetical protein